MKRIFLIVLDSVGAGALLTPSAYGDAGANRTSSRRRIRTFPTWRPWPGPDPGRGRPCSWNGAGVAGRAAEVSAGKDTTTGHWEIAGLRLDLRPSPPIQTAFRPK